MPKHTARRIQKIVAAMLLCLQILSILPAALATTVDNVNVTAASLTTNSAAIDGMVRVYLSSLGSPTTLNLTAIGNYSVNGDTSLSISSGSALTIGFSASTGAITLTQNGGATNMGKRFALRRHSTSGTNGIKISQSRESANPYPGDLSFEAVQQSNGSYKLYTIAHIYIENYLYGVLPYEMGNSSNIEALKAQAVAARTYTVRMMQSRVSGRYDVVDTTSDQVYRGTPSGNANCVAAVDATKGIVLKNGSSYTMTYYSASNGGQTESASNAWGKGGYDYLVVKDDPFDLANPSSTVKSKTVYKDLTSGSNPSALMSLLKTKAVSALKAMGYAATSANTSLLTLKSVTPHTPKFSSPSKLYTKMDFALTASTLSASGASVTASVTVTCNIFGELESQLSMSIQSSQNELWSVKKNASSFTLQARRYGHGLGMSQRGAMYMGKLGYTYDEILGFYYVGCKRVRQSFTNTILSAGSSNEETTIEDAADLTEDASGACKGTVRLVSSGSSLAIRSAKSTAASLIGTAGNGAIMTVLSSDGTWCCVQYGNLKGYVPQNALSISGTPSGADSEASTVLGFATVTANDYVNLRASSSMNASILSTAPYGAVLTVFSSAGGWAHVQYCATVAYVNMSYISSVSTSYPSAVVSTGSMSATVQTEDGMGSVNLRSTASTSGAVLAQVPHGAQVSVASDDGSWATVSYNGVSGYIMSSFLATTGESLESNTNADSNGNADVGGGSTESSVYATVKADIAYIRESQSEDAPSKLLLAKGEVVKVTEKGGEWCAVSLNNLSGYLLTSALAFSAESQASVAKAVVSTSSGSLNMRAEAKAGSFIVTTIPKGMELDVTSVGATWCGVRYLSMNGYVMTSFLSFTQGGGTDGSDAVHGGTPSDAVAADGSTTATVTTQSGSLNLRSEGRSGSAILLTIPQYATVSVYTKASDWCRVSYNGVDGYVMTVFLTFQQGAAATPTPPVTDAPSAPVQDIATVNTASGSLNLRAEPNANSGVLTRVPQYASVTVTERGAEWCGVSYAGYNGYAMTKYLRLSAAPTPTPAPSLAPAETDAAAGGATATDASVTTITPTPTPLPENTLLTATVQTSSGSLNLRSAPQSGARIVATIPQYAAVTVLQLGDEWCQVTYGIYAGYVMTKYLSVTGTVAGSNAINESIPAAPSGTQASETPAWVLTASGSLNLRVSPSGSAEVVLAIPRYSQVAVLSEQSGWSYLRFNGVTGYAMSAYLTKQNPTGQIVLTITPAPSPTPAPASLPTNDEAISQQTTAAPTDAPTPTPSPAPAPAVGRVLDGSLQGVAEKTYAIIEPREDQSRLSVWPECAESGTSLIDLDRGTEVEVLQIGNTWCQIRHGNLDGYCLAMFISIRGN